MSVVKEENIEPIKKRPGRPKGVKTNTDPSNPLKKGDTLIKAIHRDIVSKPHVSELIKNFSEYKLSENAKTTSYFNSLQADLKQIISDKKLKIYNYTTITKHYDKSNKKNNNSDIISLSFKIKTTTSELTCTKFIHTYTESDEWYYALFKRCNYNINKYCDTFNKLEKKQITRLISEAENILDKQINMWSKEYLASVDCFTNEESAELFLSYNNPWVNEYIKRRMCLFEIDIKELILNDLDYIIENRKLAIPAAFRLIWNKTCKTTELKLMAGKIRTNKSVAFAAESCDKFELFRVIQIIFTYYKELLKDFMSDEYDEMIDKIDKCLEIAEEDEEGDEGEDDEYNNIKSEDNSVKQEYYED